MKHRKRIEGQAGGEGDYLIAWHTIPAAHIYIIWNGSSEGPLGEREENEPLIEDFHVHPAARGKGIGGALLKEAESLVREKGYERVGVSVIVTNPPVEKMYKRAGFKDSGLGAFKSSRIFTGRDGVHREWSKRVKYLVKDLR
ncbi:MAG: GNAT family N-acetyltransferase [Candidatus Krumholzibacteriota bacterium]|nr:GNAT family N-acetyltransferase [Candidatus Krumholzibacteriota bacterium]